MGYLIANRYNVILVCLDNLCSTFFPIKSSHSISVSFYCIDFVNQNHWVQGTYFTSLKCELFNYVQMFINVYMIILFR